MKLNIIQSATPKPVGKRMDKSVHFMLAVSFFTVKTVVEQGQWQRVNISIEIAVLIVQPLSIKRFFIKLSEKPSSKTPFPI